MEKMFRDKKALTYLDLNLSNFTTDSLFDMTNV